jgi:restriction system protein
MDMQNSLPEFAKWINPVLRALNELGGSARPREVVELVAKNEHVTDDALDQLNPAGGQRFPNQVHWARFYLADSGYIDRSKHGVWKLTDGGAALSPLNDEALEQLVKSVQGRNAAVSKVPLPLPSLGGSGANAVDPMLMPTLPLSSVPDDERDEMLAPDQEDGDYRAKLMQILKSLAPSGFERLCQRLLREAGFEQVVVTGKSNDGGIDGHGILVLNPFVSFRVLFQCKRYAGSVVPSQVRDFRGAMQGRADKGLILTTGTFTVEARREAGRDGVPPIELVDGEKLVELFEQLELGLTPITSYEVNESFFSEYR